METTSTVFATPPSFNYATVGSRFVALIIDGLIVGIPVSIILIVLGVGAASSLSNAASSMNIAAIMAGYSSMIIVIYGVQILYYSYFESSANQASLGKRAMGIKVISLNGERISFANALGRSAFKVLISAPICAIGYIVALFTEKRQALHDMVASTLVVKS